MHMVQALLDAGADIQPKDHFRNTPLMVAAANLPEAIESLLAARACSLAFVPPTGMRFEPYATGLSCVAQIEDPDTFSGATVFRTDAGATIVACRGSASLKNFGTTTDIGPVPLIAADGAPTAARVHRGFQRACTGIWPLLKPHLPASGPLLLTGHSLGGAVAQIIGMWLHKRGKNVQIYSYGSPKVSNEVLPGGQPTHFRVVRLSDPVPLSPPFPFFHTGLFIDPVTGDWGADNDNQLISKTDGLDHAIAKYVEKLKALR
jgi:hypothetical protein